MFWFAQLPFAITSVIFIMAIVTFVILRVKKYWKRPILAFWVATFFSFPLFIPSCFVVMKAIDPFRFGIFHFPNTQSMWGCMTSGNFIPENATDISILTEANGFKANYKINQTELESWRQAVFKKNEDIYLHWNNLGKTDNEFAQPYVEQRFKKTGWPIPRDIINAGDVLQGDGRGFSLWYSPSEGMAYEDAGYW